MTIKAVLFDFDGTLSTLRAGWEEVMVPFMKESIVGNQQLTEEENVRMDREIADYIDQSTGIQTVFQMRWLKEKTTAEGWNPEVLDEWAYKAEYNRRLLLSVHERINRMASGELRQEDYLMKGSLAFLQLLQDRGVEMYVASGTDHPDVVREAQVLGVSSFFREIWGAPVGKAECSKEKVMMDLIENKKLSGHEFAVVGDGKVEIRLAKEIGSLAVGLASDETVREGVNPLKEKRLLVAGADVIVGDFTNIDQWITWLGL
ncbi:HAD family hydrolase [Paenibacillus qinlingensis]|uniref:Phosphoglycolate phosphatase-like HAD superfamily hydrolase n=1 Tax=Paenibacillus qinlingensis TaxID=1837343 RepID=A0ABU1NXN1_9BACL|nr:HAD family hydrolase [Paenibacillus qinlingensis]MDR6552233.1 phosphoglycolate phosphatase-like HAD superfamily hydrolase [Paenibacillus qinlingensis]